MGVTGLPAIPRHPGYAFVLPMEVRFVHPGPIVAASELEEVHVSES